MKKLLFSALIALSLATSAFAAPVSEVSYRINVDFQSKFKDAENVKWDIKQDFTKATFMEDGVSTEAFYNNKGEFIGKSQATPVSTLPTDAKNMIAKKFPGFAVNEAIKFEGVEETAYYVSVENEKQSVVLKVVDNTVSIFKTIKK